jgi:hypothetical protein
MNTQNYILIQKFCKHYDIPVSFVHALREFELIEIITIEENLYLRDSEIEDLEKMIRLHFELNINLEGVDAVYNLLKQVEVLKQDITVLKNKLSRFENY